MQSTCPLDLGTDLTITPSGREQYSITGISGLVSSAGWISGKHVHIEAWALINHVIVDGEVNTPTTMSGKVVSSMGINCDWIAHKS
jgi:cytoskeletal protein CcmA (bactofilin family)